jgi:hypothetical protein
MDEILTEIDTPRRRRDWGKWIDFGQSATIIALTLSLFSFYHSYVYVNQQLDVTVTEVSYGTNSGELYMTVAFTNGGNRDAAVLRLEPALWARGPDGKPKWIPVTTPVSADLPVVTPRVPLVVKSGGIEVVKLANMLNAVDAEKRLVSLPKDGAFLGIRVTTMASDRNLYLIEHPVARLTIDGNGRILGATPAIDKSLPGFTDVEKDPPGDAITNNRQKPFVWAEEHYREATR